MSTRTLDPIAFRKEQRAVKLYVQLLELRCDPRKLLEIVERHHPDVDIASVSRQCFTLFYAGLI